MDFETSESSRRSLLRTVGIGLVSLAGLRAYSRHDAWFLEKGAFAQDLVRTPEQTEGPFFPDKLPLDTDNDLLIINDRITPAVGTITHLTGKVMDIKGDPIRGAVVEIWQVDNNGAYLHSESGNREKLDKNFQGYGRFLTSSTGEYYFRTIKPVAYPGRTPHIHIKVSRGNKELITSQIYIKGEKANDNDGVILGIRDLKQRANLIVGFEPVSGSKIGELAARFDIVVGLTPLA